MTADNRGVRAWWARRSWLVALLLAPLAVVGAVATWNVVADGDASDAGAVDRRFVVNSLLDDPDASPSDESCATEEPDVCTLRAAIMQANAAPGHDRIEFDLPGDGPHRFAPETTYPALTDPVGVTIDGYTQPGSSVNSLDLGTDAVINIELVGTGPTGINGLEIESPDNVVRGLALFDFELHIRLFGNNAHDNEVIGNFIGTSADASYIPDERTRESNGVHIELGANSNRVGKPGNEHRNLIGGNADDGVAIFDSGSDFNLIQNNVFGLSPDGSARLTNRGHGVDINYNASNNSVGGANPGEGNVISGSDMVGVEISHDRGDGATTGNLIANNLIGTNLDGSAGPMFAANLQLGINFEGAERCADDCPPDISGNRATDNVIVGSEANVLIWKGANTNSVTNNMIGVLGDGSPAESSSRTLWAVMIQNGAFDNMINNNVVAGVDRGIHVKPGTDYPDDCLPEDTTCPADAVFDTYGNTFSRNSIYDIEQGLGIDLWAFDVERDRYRGGPSEVPGPLVNGQIELPTIVDASTDAMTVTACGGCTVEVYVTPEVPAESAWFRYGRGQTYLTEGVADAAGDLTITFRSSSTDPLVVASGASVVVLATDERGNTSEHSQRMVVDVGDLASP